MTAKEGSPIDIVRPLQKTSRKWYAIAVLCLLVLGAWLVGYYYQLSNGLIVTGLGDWGSGGGSTWGLYIGSFIWWVGIAHGGIILSAAVRLIGLKRYQPVARMAEFLTLFALMAAGLFILVHVGRPDRLVSSVLLNYQNTVHTSPLAWDLTVITAYFVLTATYLGLTLRYDIVKLREYLPNFMSPVYRVMTIGYREDEEEVMQRMVWWVALAIIIMAPLLLHGGVIPWLFAVLPNFPGWYGGIMGPTFLSIALTSAVAGIIVAAYVFRRVYDWYHIVTDEVMRGLTLWLGFFSLMFSWLQLQQIVTGDWHPTVQTGRALDVLLAEPLYWLSVGSIFVILVGYIFAQAVRPSIFTPERSLVASIIVLAATLTEKILFVIEGFDTPAFALYYAIPGSYFPSVIEMLALLGTIALVTLAFMIVSKVVPVIELHAVEHHKDEPTTAESEVKQ